MNILILGNKGMLGMDVMKHFTDIETVKRLGIENVTGFDVKTIPFDVCKDGSMTKWMSESDIRYDFCINCIAYTNTTSEENTDEGNDIGYMLNSIVPLNIAKACDSSDTKLIHISTDYVFSEKTRPESSDGLKYSTTQNPFPKNEYGKHKLMGELFIMNTMSGDDYSILRTSWIYSTGNNKSFIHKFLANCMKRYMENKEKSVIDIDMTSNEHSMPTSCSFLVDKIEYVMKNWDVIRHDILNAVPKEVSHNRLVSRYDFAKEILSDISKMTSDNDIKNILGRIQLNPKEVYSYYPHNSTLESSFPYVDWKNDLSEFIERNIPSIEKFCIEKLNVNSTLL